jgi:Domain of unknown function (DUF4259)
MLRRMGTWGEGAFDNDAAADWAHRFERADRASGIALIEDALGRGSGDTGQQLSGCL